MDSILYQIYQNYFSSFGQTSHQAQVLENRLSDCRKTYDTLFQQLSAADPVLQTEIFEMLRSQTAQHLDEQPEMFCLGFRLGVQLMIEVLAFE